MPHNSAPITFLFLEKAISEKSKKKEQGNYSNRMITKLALSNNETQRTINAASTTNLRPWARTSLIMTTRAQLLVEVTR